MKEVNIEISSQQGNPRRNEVFSNRIKFPATIKLDILTKFRDLIKEVRK